MTFEEIEQIISYMYEEDMCVYPEGQNFDCVNCTICREVFKEKLYKEINYD